MVSYGGELYMYGGFATRFFLGDNRDLASIFKREAHFMTRLDKVTCAWEPVSYEGAPRDSWGIKQLSSAGRSLQLYSLKHHSQNQLQ